MSRPLRLAVVTTHPIQYQAPLWRRLAQSDRLHVSIFFVSRHGTEERFDPSFGCEFAWDLPLLDGYQYEFLDTYTIPGSRRGQELTWGPAGGLLARGLAGKLRHGKYDAVLVQGYASGAAWAATVAARLTGTPILLRGESHDRGRQTNLRQVIRRNILSLWMRQMDGVIAIGKLNRDMWRNLGVPEERIITSLYAVENDRFRQSIDREPRKGQSLRSFWGASPCDVVILFCGKLTDIKAPDLLLDAFSSLPAHARAHVVFVGAGALEAQLRESTRQKQLARVHFAGFVNQSELPYYYNAADVLVLPSRKEPWGLVVNEAMACGTPCIVSDAVGCGPDLIEGFQAGSVFPSGDKAALTGHLCAAFDVHQRTMWRANLDVFARTVTLDRNVDAIVEAVERVVLLRAS